MELETLRMWKTSSKMRIFLKPKKEFLNRRRSSRCSKRNTRRSTLLMTRYRDGQREFIPSSQLSLMMLNFRSNLKTWSKYLKPWSTSLWLNSSHWKTKKMEIKLNQMMLSLILISQPKTSLTRTFVCDLFLELLMVEMPQTMEEPQMYQEQDKMILKKHLKTTIDWLNTSWLLKDKSPDKRNSISSKNNFVKQPSKKEKTRNEPYIHPYIHFIYKSVYDII